MKESMQSLCKYSTAQQECPPAIPKNHQVYSKCAKVRTLLMFKTFLVANTRESARIRTRVETIFLLTFSSNFRRLFEGLRWQTIQFIRFAGEMAMTDEELDFLCGFRR